MNRSLLLASLLACTAAHAELPTYIDIELQARSNLLVNDEGWNMPPGTSFNNNSPRINDNGQVTFGAGMVPIDGDLSRYGAGLWLGGHAKGSFVVIHEPPAGSDPNEPPTMIISDRPGINALGEVAYYTSVDGGPYTLRKYDPATETSAPVSLMPVVPSSISNTDISDDGTIGFKGRMGFGYVIGIGGNGPGALYAVDTGVDEENGYAYIYSPATNNANTIAVKVSTSDYNHNEIRAFDGWGVSRLLVADKATDPTSPFAKFDNGLGHNNHGAIAVVLSLAEGNVRAIYRFTPGKDGVEATEIARVDGAGTILVIDSFAPDINDDGLVAFRASDATGQAIYVGDGKGLVRVAGKGDVVGTDQGEGQIGQHDSSPIFSGAPSINAHGDVTFIAGVHPNGDNQEEWGNGVFVAYTERPEEPVEKPIFRDGFDG